MINENSADWQKKKPEIFWAEISPSNHLIQIYEEDKTFLDSLEHFVSAGILNNEVTIIIGTSNHLSAIEHRLKAKGIDTKHARKTDLFIPLDAQETLDKFMVDGWPDEGLFERLVHSLIARAEDRRIRAFGEMVALLWGQGFTGATVRLEDMWNKFCHTGAFCLFCAYPKTGHTQDVSISMDHICNQHTTVVAGWNTEETDVLYKAASA